MSEPSDEIVKLINELRTGEGDSVTILSDGVESWHSNNVILCCGGWTDWDDLRFDGDSLLDCLKEAVVAKRLAE